MTDWPAVKFVTMKSSNESENDSRAAARMPGKTSGKLTRQNCITAQQRAEAVVHTGNFPAPDRLRQLGDYTAVQWQQREPGKCDGKPGAEYQALVKMRPAEARKLRAGFDWLVADTFDTQGMWPGMVGLVPPGVKWQDSWQVDNVLLDPDKAIAHIWLPANPA